MKRMNRYAAAGWLVGGAALFAVGTLLAFVLPFSKKITPSETPKEFFKAQYDILYPAPGKPKFNPQHPNPNFKLTQTPAPPPQYTPKQKQEFEEQHEGQIPLLTSWGFAGCVQTDGTAAQKPGDSACFCENAPAVRAIFDGGSMVQPSNTVSAASLSIAGLVILAFLVFLEPLPQANLMTVTYFFALCYAGMSICLGPLSMMLHLGLRRWGEFGDDLSLYAWFGFVACYAWFRFIALCIGVAPEKCPWWARYLLFPLAWLVSVGVPALLTAPFSTGQVMSSTPWYGILGGIALAGELFLWLPNAPDGVLQRVPVVRLLPECVKKLENRIGSTNTPSLAWLRNWTGSAHTVATVWWSNGSGGSIWFASAGLTFALALFIWEMSFTQNPWCRPDWWFQGHAVFHCLSAVAVGLLYKYYRHEGEAQSTA
jgi:hypothetical protein